MPLIIIRILFFCLIPGGIFLLIKAIGLLRKAFGGKILVEIPFITKHTTFTIDKDGTFAIWHMGGLFKRSLVDHFKPVITNTTTHETISLYPSILRPSSNDGSMVRMELFTFSAPAGNYTLELADGSSISKLEVMVTGLIPAQPVDPQQYFIQVRESEPFYLKFLGIPLILLSAAFIIGGFVVGLIADHLFK